MILSMSDLIILMEYLADNSNKQLTIEEGK